MTVEEKITRGEAFKRGYLEHRVVYLKPVPRGGKMVNDPNHIAYFQYEGASNWFQLPKDKRNVLVNPFRSEEEKRFFEQELDVDLNIHKKKEENFWTTFFVKVVKNRQLMVSGYKLDLSDPMDNLRYRVLKHQDQVAPSWDERFDRPSYRFALVDEDYEEVKENTKSQKLIEAYTYLGSIQGSTTKMRDFLGVYNLDHRTGKEIPEDAEKEWLVREVKRLIESDIDGFLAIRDDNDWEIKKLIYDNIRSGAIIKHDRNSFSLVGEDVKYTFSELVHYLNQAKEVKSDTYLKLIAQKNIKG